MTFTRKVTLPDSNRSAGSACRVKIRIGPAYTWLCQFVQALPAIGLVKIGQKARTIRYLLQKIEPNPFRSFFEWKRIKDHVFNIHEKEKPAMRIIPPSEFLKRLESDIPKVV